MPSAKSGSPGTIVPPTKPETALDADSADPGVVEELKSRERQTKTGKYGKAPAPPFKGDEGESAESSTEESTEKKKKSWIEIKLVDADGLPVAGEAYEVTLPDGSVASGSTGADGTARVEGFDPGQCKVSFPNLDKTVVKPG